MTATTTTDQAAYEAYRDDMLRHSCEELALTYEQWCTACREANR